MTGRLGGVGVYARDRAQVSLFGCVLKHNEHGVGLDDGVTVLVYNTTITASRNEAFYCGQRSMGNALLVLRASRVDGPPWYRRYLCPFPPPLFPLWQAETDEQVYECRSVVCLASSG